MTRPHGNPPLMLLVEMEVTGHMEFMRAGAPDGASRFSFHIDDVPASGPPVAGSAPVEITPGDMAGPWSLRFGMFGCADSETRGGVIHVADGMFAGGDSIFAYLGRWTLDGIELRATLDIARHSRDAGSPSIFGTREDVYHADCIAHAITPDLFEGRILRPGFPDARLTMRRMVLRQTRSI